MRNKLLFKFALILIGAFVILQFVRPARNLGETPVNGDSLSIQTPAEINTILQTSCYDCHSNHTNYPWYTNIQPIGLWMQHHVDEGKEELNFSVFNTYSAKRKKHKLKEIMEEVEEHEMPLSSYTMIHKETELSAEQISTLTKWAAAEMEKIIEPGH
ncbi:MAG: heme-binding domain-containing protein [Bacteroidota bacterium]